MEPLLSKLKESLTLGLLQLNVPGLILSFPQNNLKERARGTESDWEWVWESFVIFDCRGNKMIRKRVKWLKAKWDEESQSPWFAWGVEGADVSQICLRKNCDNEESEVSVVEVRNNSMFVEHGFRQARWGWTLGCIISIRAGKQQDFHSIQESHYHSFVLPQQLFLFISPVWMKWMNRNQQKPAQLVLNFLGNIFLSTHGLYSVTDRELFWCLRTVTFGPTLLKNQNHNSKKPLWKSDKSNFSSSN